MAVQSRYVAVLQCQLYVARRGLQFGGCIDERFAQIKTRRRELGGRHEALGYAAGRDVDLEKATAEALAYLGRFRDVLATGTFYEQKAFVAEFVEKIELDAAEKVGKVYIRDMAAASLKLRTGNRQKLYRRMQRLSIPGRFGRT